MSTSDLKKLNKVSRLRTIEQLASLPNSALVGTSEAAIMLCRGRETLRRWRKNGIGPSFLRHPINKDRAEYSVGDIRTWLEGRIERPGE